MNIAATGGTKDYGILEDDPNAPFPWLDTVEALAVALNPSDTTSPHCGTITYSIEYLDPNT